MNRMTFFSLSSLIIILVLFFTLSFTSGCNDIMPKQLDVYVWEGYLPESIATLFEKETGIRLNIAFISENDHMLALLRGGATADVIMPSGNNLIRVYENDLAQSLDLNKISNYEKVSRSLREQPWAKWDGSKMGSGDIYAIPYVFGACGLAINTSKYTKDLEDIGWEVLFDTALKSRVSSKNNLPTLWIICYLCGIPMDDIINNPQGTMNIVKDRVIELKNNVLKFWYTGSESIDLMKNEEVWVSEIEDGAGRELSNFDAKFKFVLPREGGLGFTDTFSIPKKAANPSGAYLFIDFMLRPEVAASITEQSGYNTTIEGALDMTEGIDKDMYRYTQEQLAKLKWQPNLSQELRSEYLKFWEEITVQ